MATRVPPLPTISDIVGMYRLQSKKQLGQNFLLDMNVNRRLAKAAGSMKDGYVCEVGPGPGGLTRAIFERHPKGVVVVEKDERFLPCLKNLSETVDHRLKIVHGDILNFQMDHLFPESEIKEWEDTHPNIHIIGNLPFNVSTPLVIKWMKNISERSGAWRFGRTQMTLTFQKEVADRIVAPNMNRERGRLSVMCQYLCTVEKKFSIKRQVFVPSPQVDAGVVHFTPRKVPLIDLPFTFVEKVARHLFHYRARHIIHGLRTLFPPHMKHLADDLLYEARLDHNLRSFMLRIEDIKILCEVFREICDAYPVLENFDYRGPEGLKMEREFRLQRKKKYQESLIDTSQANSVTNHSQDAVIK